MTQTTYTIKLSVDGNHSVSVTSDNMAEMKLATNWAKTTFEAIKGRYAEPIPANGEDAEQDQIGQPFEDGVPNCAIHQAPMDWVEKGGFFSCHKKNPDGSWCKSSYRPPKAA